MQQSEINKVKFHYEVVVVKQLRRPSLEACHMHFNNFQLLQNVRQVSRRISKKYELIQDKLKGLFKNLQWSECLVPNIHKSSYQK